MTMKFVHHNTGEWVRPNHWSTVRRYPSDACVHEYASIGEIDNAFVRQTFIWMLEIGEVVTQCGSDVFQIRQGESK
jgi:hypothetical protein